MKKIGILTGGLDCPGFNSVIRAVVRKAMTEGFVVSGVKNGWLGMYENDMKVLDLRLTSGILDRGGTILGTSRMVMPLEKEYLKTIYENFERSGMDALITVGGEDTLKIALELYNTYKMPIVGVPKSTDNALSGTDYAFGFDTAVNIATACIDRLHTTAESHHRIIVIEVMGQYTGWIALEAGIAGGADMILIPEFPVDIDKVCQSINNRHARGRTFTILVVSEGTKIKGYEKEETVDSEKLDRHGLGRIGQLLGTLIEDKTGYDTRVSVLGNIQRGGAPTAIDRVISTRFGVKAVELVKNKKFGQMVAIRDNKTSSVAISEAVKKHKPINMDLYEIAQVFSG